MRRLCACNIAFEPGRPFLNQCPQCGAADAAEVLDRLKQEPFGDGGAAIQCMSLIMGAVFEWPHILSETDRPGMCIHCGARAWRRFDGLCYPCTELLSEQDGSTWCRDDFGPDFNEGPQTYAEKHG